MVREVAVGVTDQRREQLLAVGEVAVQRRRGDVHRPGDVGEPHLPGPGSAHQPGTP
jgi:hypothetical protein